VVVNGSQAGAPVAGAEVQLRAGQGHALESIASATTDIYGKFCFEGLPADATIEYLPGANRDGVHYPGQRVNLRPDNQIAKSKIVTFDAVRSPSPLVAERHGIEVDVQEHVMEVTESLVVANRSNVTFIGQSHGGETPVTLQLSIPPSFDRVTFAREFFGRRFRIVDHRLVTDLPWPPGAMELKFTYRIPLEENGGLFRRPLDLASLYTQIRVRTKVPQPIACNLPAAAGVSESVVFGTAQSTRLAAGHVVELQIGGAPIPWGLYARWGAVGSFAALVSATLLVIRQRGRRLRRLQHSVESMRGNGGRAKQPRRAKRRAA
jgi:hypothetical protein